MTKIEQIVAQLQENGPMFGSDLCRELDIKIDDFMYHINRHMKEGLFIVDRRAKPGQSRLSKCFRLSEQGPAAAFHSALTSESYDFANPFGVVSKHRAQT